MSIETMMILDKAERMSLEQLKEQADLCMNGICAAANETTKTFLRRRMAIFLAEIRKRESKDLPLANEGWTSVADGVPDADELVLTINAKSEAYFLCNWDGQDWEDANTCEIRTVTHWMRLTGILAPPQLDGGAR